MTSASGCQQERAWGAKSLGSKVKNEQPSPKDARELTKYFEKLSKPLFITAASGSSGAWYRSIHGDTKWTYQVH